MLLVTGYNMAQSKEWNRIQSEGWYSIRCETGPNMETTNIDDIRSYQKDNGCFVFKFEPWTNCPDKCLKTNLGDGGYASCCSDNYLKQDNLELWKAIHKKN